MKRKSFLCISVILLTFGILLALEPVDIKTILNDPYHFRQSLIMIRGTVTQYGDEANPYSQYYYLRDNNGAIIKIIADLSLPIVNKPYEIEGTVFINEKGEVNIIERKKKELITFSSQQPQAKKEIENYGIYYLIGVAVIFLVIVIIFALIMRKSQEYPIPIPGPTIEKKRLNNRPKPVPMIEGGTIKMARPPAGTLKLLPGKLEVVSGEDIIKNIRFYKAKAQEETEITFGRNPGTDHNYTYIQLKSDTVSVKQAKLIYTNGKYRLINYSTINPTIVNNQPLGHECSVILEEGTKIEMGVVTFVFHEK